MGLLRFRHARTALLLATLLVAGSTLVPATATAASQGCADDATGVSDLTASWEDQLLQLTNDHRASMGLVALRLDTTLTRASVWKARDMARRDYFTHDDPANGSAPARSPWDRLEACGWNTGGARAENIAAGYSSASAVVQGWLDSPGHRANIENASMRFVGFGVASSAGSSYGRYQVQMFASVAGPSSTTPIGQPPASGGDDDAGGGDPSTDDDQTRTPQQGGDDDAAAATTRVMRVTSRVVRTPCRGRLAVRGWCYRLLVSGRVMADGEPSARRTVVVSRRLASRRLVRVARLRTSPTGWFRASVAMRPPARGTTRWLRRNATVLRVGVARSAAASPAVRWHAGRVVLRRR